MLVDTHALVMTGWRSFAAQRGLSFTDREIVDRMFGRRTLDVLTDVFAFDPAAAADLVAAGIDDKRAEVAAGAALRPIPGAAEFVRATLAARVPCAVVSSASGTNIRLALDAIGLADAFEVIVDHDRVGRGKPAPDPYVAGADALGLRAAQCVVFEDTQAGIASAHAAGAACVGVASLGRPDLLVGAALVIADFRGLEPRELLSRLDDRVRRAAERGARCRCTSRAGAADERLN